MRTTYHNTTAYTLIELVIAIAVSGIVIVGIAIFSSRIQENILTASARANMQTGVSEFSSRIRELRSTYPGLKLIDGGSQWQDAIILTSSGLTSWYIAAPVRSSSEGKYFFEGTGSTMLTHQDRRIAIKSLTRTEILGITASWVSIDTLIPASSSEVVRGLIVWNFKATLYNSGSIADITLTALEKPLWDLVGRPRSDVPIGEGYTYVFNF